MTPWSLVARAGDTNTDAMREALQTLLQRYLPALRAHLVHHRRLPPDLADDLLQSFISRKVLKQRLIAQVRPRTRTLPPLSSKNVEHSRLRPASPITRRRRTSNSSDSPTAIEQDLRDLKRILSSRFSDYSA